MKQAVIIAGGKGTRLRECLGDLPKCLVDICGKPLLARQLDLLARYGYTDVLILVNDKKEAILEFCGTQNQWGLNLICIDEGAPRGTAGAMLAAQQYLHDEFLVVYGDLMLDVDLDRFYTFFQSKGRHDPVLYLHPNDHPYDSDLVALDHNAQIIGFHPYPHQQHYANLVNAALYYMHRNSISDFSNVKQMLDFGKDIFPAMLQQGKRLFGYRGSEYLKDCGTPERLKKVQNDVATNRVTNLSFKYIQKAVFLDRDGVLNHEIGHISVPQNFRLLDDVASAIKKLNQSTYRTVVITNQSVIARGECDIVGLNKIHNKMESELGSQGAYLDRIYYCPHHPTAGFVNEIPELKINCTCRKPNIGMIKTAIADLNIDSSQSWFIGDSTTDIMTAKNAGLRSILVKTGLAGGDGKFSVTPDYTCDNLSAAVNLILG